ncbi:hypothetical protein [Clostridium akagii]|uniref:hypothetical protein n=1 Tax=Clostridium akagii TaxID=91623 RepID=UPI00047E05B8|nr:hypothetical protein [Clostridium akagii]
MRFKAEIFDKLQFLFETYKFNDHQLHCVMKFDNKVQKDIMEKALTLMFQVVPILGSAFVEDSVEPYWEKVEVSNFKDILTIVENEEDFNNFITSRTNEFSGPQMKACIYSSSKDSLAVIMNHMICDAAGFKEYMYLLSDLYSKLIEDFNYVPDHLFNGDRSLKRINQKFSLKEKINVLLLQNKESNKSSDYKFPLSQGKDVKPFIVTNKISQIRFLTIKEYCKKYKVTINDVALAGLYRALYKMLRLDNNSELNVPIMVDMRRNLKVKNMDAICNLASTAITHIDYDINDNFTATVMKVNNDMNLKKTRFIGLNGFVKLSLIFRIFKYNRIKKMMKNLFKNPLIGMTNIGILDCKKLIFEDSSIDEAFMCGSIKYKPYFQVALTSFKDTITFSTNLYGNAEDKKIIEEFLNLLVSELPNNFIK